MFYVTLTPKNKDQTYCFALILHCTTKNLRITFNGIVTVFNIVSDLRNVEDIQKSTLIGFFE